MTTKRHIFLFRVTAAATLACAAMSPLLWACATHESASPDAPDATVTLPPEEDAGLADADADIDACTTDDCAYFPATCAPDALCPNGPFNAEDPASGLDWRTRINVVVGRSASDVWYAGAAGAVGHFDGTSWTASDIGTSETQNILWLLDSAEVLIGTPNSPSRIYTRGLEVDAGSPPSAGGWTRQPKLSAPAGFEPITAAWGAPGSTTLWVSAGTLWRIRPTPQATFEVAPGIAASVCNVLSCRALRGLHGASRTTVWAVGDRGAVVRITDADGAEPIAKAVDSRTWMGLRGVWAASDTDVWAVGGAGTILHYAGEALGWESVADVPTKEDLNAVWGTSPSDIWAVGDAGVVLHYDGARWSRVKVAGVGDRRPNLFTVWAPARGRVWAGGDGILLALGEQP